MPYGLTYTGIDKICKNLEILLPKYKYEDYQEAFHKITNVEVNRIALNLPEEGKS